ncbi:MAG: response regulator [Candidatus Zixiibacteriota bacterium]|nr:MAG: response regulator [candidate division Zixibacteria bacterium]
MKEYVKILVVEDEAMMRNLLLKILESEGYQVTLASSGAEALDKLECEKYDLMLSDVKMPGMNGFELLEKVKSQWNDMAVIVMTGYGDAYTIKEALMKGADEYLSKPFKSHEVSLIVERAYWRLLSARNSAEKSRQSAATP